MLLHTLFDLENRFGIKSCEGLVQYPDLRIVYEGRHYGYLLLHTVRIGLDGVVDSGFEVESRNVVGNTLVAILMGYVIKISNIVYVLSAAEVLVKRIVIGNVSYLHLGFHGLLVNVVARDLNITRGDGLNADNGLYNR